MKPFRFPLEAILTLREEVEQEAQRAVARALQAVRLVQADLTALAAEADRMAVEMKSRLNEGKTAADLERYGNYRTLLAERRKRREQDLAMAEASVREARQRLLKSTQDRQALENYRAKLRTRFDYRQSCEERKLLDDLAGRPSALGVGRKTNPASSTP
jgi:flagellar export protein FliJ